GRPFGAALRLPRDRGLPARPAARLGCDDARVGRAGPRRGAPLPAAASRRHPAPPRRSQRGRAAVRPVALLDFYPGASRELLYVAPSSIGARSIGHFGFFHRRFRDTLWSAARSWLLSQAQSQAAA